MQWSAVKGRVVPGVPFPGILLAGIRNPTGRDPTRWNLTLLESSLAGIRLCGNPSLWESGFAGIRFWGIWLTGIRLCCNPALLESGFAGIRRFPTHRNKDRKNDGKDNNVTSLTHITNTLRGERKQLHKESTKHRQKDKRKQLHKESTNQRQNNEIKNTERTKVRTT